MQTGVSDSTATHSETGACSIETHSCFTVRKCSVRAVVVCVFREQELQFAFTARGSDQAIIVLTCGRVDEEWAIMKESTGCSLWRRVSCTRMLLF